jgi:hypothetical protein
MRQEDKPTGTTGPYEARHQICIKYVRNSPSRANEVGLEPVATCREACRGQCFAIPVDFRQRKNGKQYDRCENEDRRRGAICLTPEGLLVYRPHNKWLRFGFRRSKFTRSFLQAEISTQPPTSAKRSVGVISQ